LRIAVSPLIPIQQFQCVSDYCAATPSKNRPHKLEVGLAKLKPYQRGKPIRFRANDRLLAFLDAL
jgi:hypothetical protein